MKILSLLCVCLYFNFDEAYTYPYHKHVQERDHDGAKLKVLYSWKFLDFAYPTENLRQQAIDSGEYNIGFLFPIDVEVIKGTETKVLITLPRTQRGVPATLGRVTDKISVDGNPLITAYPSWDWHQRDNCDNITSVFRTTVDECGRLWVIDNGRRDNKQACPPQLLAFDPKTDELISRYRFPSNQIVDTSLFATPVVDIRDPQGECRDTFVYIADVNGFQLIVYDHQQNRSWNIQNKLFHFYVDYVTIYMDNSKFDLMDGIIGLALGPIQSNGDRILYFH